MTSESERDQTNFLSIDFAGRNFVLDGRSGADLVARQMQDGSYEAPLPMLLMAVLSRTSGLFLDVGANNGLYSILAAKTRGDIDIWAFEPYPPVAEVLAGNLRANNIEQRVRVNVLALSDSDGEVDLFIPDPAHGLLETSASLEAEFKLSTHRVTVEKLRLDSLDLPRRISVIKVDIEGHEAAFLHGALRSLEQHRPIVFAEMLIGAQKHFYQISKLLNSRHYKLFRLRSNCVIAVDFVEYDPQSWNYAFVPVENLRVFASCCEAHGLEMFRFY